MNATRELVHLDNFRSVCSVFPVGRIEKAESPDFLIHTDDGIVGVEHTEVFQPGPPDSASLQAQDSLAYRVIGRSKDLWREMDGPPLLVQVLFNPRRRISIQNVENLAQSVVDIIRCAHLELGETVTLRRSPSVQKRFPPEVVFVDVYRSRMGSVGENRWECSSVGYIPAFTREDVQSIIDRKKSRIDLYLSKCSEVWLLMVADGLRIPGCVDLSSAALGHYYATRFNRVFFFWNADRQIVELRTHK